MAINDILPFIQYISAREKRVPYATGARRSASDDLFLKKNEISRIIRSRDIPTVITRSAFMRRELFALIAGAPCMNTSTSGWPASKLSISSSIIFTKSADACESI